MDQSNENARRLEYQLYREAEQLMMREHHGYLANAKKDKNLDYSWIRSVLQKGTLSDKIAANVLLIQDSPKSNLKSLEFLVDLMNTKAKRESMMAINPIKELFLGNLLKSDQKLRRFNDHIAELKLDRLNEEARNQALIDAYFEDRLKQLYFKFIQLVEQFTHDPEPKTKKVAIMILYDLLINNCEQEQFLLEKIVNKLGDLDPKSATSVVHLLERLVNEHHPAMKEIVIKEVERLLYRPNVAYAAQYNALTFLSLVLFLRREQKVANLVMEIYLNFFKLCLKKEQVNNRVMAVLLTGIARAFPFSELENNYLEEKIDTIYKLVHHVNFNISIQAYNLILKMITKENSEFLTDRYCISLYRSLLNPSIDECSKKATYLNVLYKTMKNDCMLKRNLAFIRRILQICLHNPSNLVAALLIMLASLVKEKKELAGELANRLTNKSGVQFDDDEEDEEHYEDVQTDDEMNQLNMDGVEESEDDSNSTLDLNQQQQQQQQKTAAKSSSWVFKKVNTTTSQQTAAYEPLHRNPLYANAETASPYELLPLKNHYHPTVALFTEKLMNREPIDYDGDVLYDFNTKSFLDKFVYKNPKKISKLESKKAKEKSKFEREVNYRQQRLRINTPSYLSERENKIPIEERFIYTFLKNRTKYEDDDAESVTNEDFERFVLNKFEANFDRDLRESITNLRKKQPDDEEASSEDEDIDIDFEQDDDYNEAFKEFDGVLKLKDKKLEQSESEGSESDDDEEAAGASRPQMDKFKRKGRDKNLMSLLASADEFAHLLQENDEEDERDDDVKFAGDLSDIGSDESDDQSELDFDDDEELLEKRKSRSNKRKAKELKDSQILEKKLKKMKRTNKMKKLNRKMDKKRAKLN